jgi:hypothetical protein
MDMRPTHSAGPVGTLVESGILLFIATVTLLGVVFIWFNFLAQPNRTFASFPYGTLMLTLLGIWCGYFGIRRLLDAGNVSLHDDSPD